jgi:hypothetical protein
VGADNDIAGVVAYGKGHGEFKLPCGYVDGKEKLHNIVILRELTGEEEDTLDDDSLTTSTRITRILGGCCEKIGDIEDRDLITRAIGDTLKEGEGLPISQADRMALMLFLRRTTNGDRYKLPEGQRTCPYCSNKNGPMHIDLQDLAVTYSKNPAKRRVRFDLKGRGEKAIMKVLSAGGEEALAKLMRGQTKKGLRSLAILARLEQVGEVKLDYNSRDSLKFVKSLSQPDRARIREVYNKVEGAIDTELEMTCEKLSCSRDWKTDIDIGQVFFLPQVVEISEADLEWI